MLLTKLNKTEGAFRSIDYAKIPEHLTYWADSETKALGVQLRKVSDLHKVIKGIKIGLAIPGAAAGGVLGLMGGGLIAWVMGRQRATSQ